MKSDAKTQRADAIASKDGLAVAALKECEFALGEAIRTDKVGWLQQKAHKTALQALNPKPRCRCYINASYKTDTAWRTGKLPKPCPVPGHDEDLKSS